MKGGLINRGSMTDLNLKWDLAVVRKSSGESQLPAGADIRGLRGSRSLKQTSPVALRLMCCVWLRFSDEKEHTLAHKKAADICGSHPSTGLLLKAN
jgi:hypothetical protein